MRNEHSAGAVLLSGPANDILFLLLKHKDGHWGFPKGHMLQNEDEIDCAIREIVEETGITREQLEFVQGFRRVIDYSYKRTDGEEIHEESTYFLASVQAPVSVALSPEHTEYAWMTVDQALNSITYENLRWVLKDANQFISEQNKKTH